MRIFLLALFMQVQVAATDFQQWFQTSDLTSYINYISDDMLYETETTGQWTLPDRMLFSIRGNSYTQNRFYLNGFRVDSRFLSGSMDFVPDMRQTDLVTDVQRGALYLSDAASAPSEIWLGGNVGGLGGISPGTKQLINLFHASASERLHKPVVERSRMLGAGELSVAYSFHTAAGDTLYNRVYAHAGSRRIVTFDEGGENGFYDAPFFKVQLHGCLPMGQQARQKGWQLRYLMLLQQRPDLYSELGYNANEVAAYKGYRLSLYATQQKADYRLTTGLTYALGDLRHREQGFERNVVDQDGEGFDPWYADGNLTELTWALRFEKPLLEETTRRPGLSLLVEGFNSLLHWAPTQQNEWTNNVYCRFDSMPRQDWYTYHFATRSFAGAILENSAMLRLEKRVTPTFALRASLALTEDGLVLRDKALLLPSWEAELDMHFLPVRWFDAHVLLGRYRSKYTWEQMRLLSSDYLNATLDGRYAPYPVYGGKYLAKESLLQQPAYAVLDIPLVFTVKERHVFSILNTARLYYHNWAIAKNTCDDAPYFLLHEQAPIPEGGLFAMPLYLSNTVKYAYTGRKTFFSISWQSYQMSARTMLGNGAENNSIGSLGYAMAMPEALTNKQDKSSSGELNRVDQDKSFILRLQMGANFTENWQLMANFHFQDGTPISNYVVEKGQVVARRVKGINPVNGQFGMRKDAYFNLDLRLRYQGNLNMRSQHLGTPGALPFAVEVSGYNLYDFGTGWYEYSFDQHIRPGRQVLSLTIPRGLLMKFSVALR